MPGVAPYTRGRTLSRPEDGWDVRARVRGPGREGHREGGASPTSRTAPRRCGCRSARPASTPEDLADRPRRGAPRPGAGRARRTVGDPVAAAEAFARRARGAGRHPGRGHQPRRGPDRRGRAPRPDPRATLRAGRDAGSPSSPARPACSASSSTRPPSTTGAPPTPRSSATALAVGATYLRVLRGRRGRRRRGRAAGRVPLRRDRRAVPDHRQAARRPPALGAGARAQRRAEAAGQRQHAVTSRPMMSKYDPWVNMLRTTVAAFAAGVGGADAVTVLPFDSPLGLPDAFGRRIARNTSRAAGRRVARRQGRPTRPAARTPSRSSPTTSPRPPGRSSAGSRSRRRRRGARRRLAARADRRGRRRARRAGRHAHAAAHRAHRVPEPRRDAARAARRRRRADRGPPLRRGLRGAARRAGRRRRSSWPRWAPVAAHTARATFADQPVRRRRHRRRRRPGRPTDVDGPARGVRRPAGRLPGRHRRGVRRVGRRARRRRSARPGARWVIVAGKPTRPRASTTPARWASTRSTSCPGRGRQLA